MFRSFLLAVVLALAAGTRTESSSLEQTLGSPQSQYNAMEAELQELRSKIKVAESKESQESEESEESKEDQNATSGYPCGRVSGCCVRGGWGHQSCSRAPGKATDATCAQCLCEPTSCPLT
mmetsp:Transcript_99899/g.223890  ORF Transcript_99899/g.223890 Transcript_99899/m.223890 type:complete len:121 (-) Transcript_99899:87-449(-)